MLPKKFIALCILISLPVIGINQENNYLKKKTLGISLGNGIMNEDIVDDIYYKVFPIIVNYSIPIINNEYVRKSNFILQLEPQFNPVYIKDEKNEFETGFNIGLIFNYKLSEDLLMDIGLSSGPHYISKETNFQKNGFVFSNNLILGFSKRINGKKSDWEVILQGRFRHMSNASLDEPNYGIDHIFIFLGVAKVI